MSSVPSPNLLVPAPGECVVIPEPDLSHPSSAVDLYADEAQEVEEDGERRPLLDKPAPVARPWNKEVLGLACMAVSALLFSLMSVLVKLSGARFPFLQIVLSRSIVQLTLGVISCWLIGVAPWGPPGVNKLWLVARGTAGATGLALYFYTIVNMPLGDGMTIFFTGPAFTAVLARLTLKEPLTSLDMVASLACLSGVALVSRPEFLFGPHPISVLAGINSGNHHLAALAALGGALMSSVAYCLVRKIGTSVHFMVQVVYFGGMSTLLSSFGLLLSHFLSSSPSPTPLSSWTLKETLTLLLVGVTAFIAQCFLNKGLQMAPAGPATLMRNLDIVFAFIFGLTLFGEVPLWTSVLGASIILGATASVALVKWVRGRRQI
ncbi:hypothetical protein DFS34DRAFT_705447 [Phlyctochytrium arcticum]|nr:hypothetical protein DFS34DRAFT_705447 [Phlyctochytrium arcticum]